MKLVIAWPLLLLSALLCCSHVSAASVHYAVSGAGEGQTPPVSDLWITTGDREAQSGKRLIWWRMTLRKVNGELLSIRALSERPPMTSASGAGEIARYQLKVGDSGALEYADKDTGQALLPQLQFRTELLPRPAPDARFTGGFASTGQLLGHVVRLVPGSAAPDVDFSHVKRLAIRAGLLIGTSRGLRDNGKPRARPGDDYTYVPLTQADLERAISAGFNYFDAISGQVDWLLTQPVFVRSVRVFPDDLYRSNTMANAMFIDEPMVRLGWSGGVPGQPSGPEVIAEALRMSVASHEPLAQRILRFRDVSTGTATWVRPKAPAWDTEFWTAWYQLEAGAPGLIHEGRYVHHGGGWDPETLLGQGAQALSDRDMFNFFYAFLRGAARGFNGFWGTSIYGQSDPALRLPALIRAYDMGAKHLWFWTSDHDHHVPFEEQLRLARGISDYASSHPRGPGRKLPLKATTAIVLPAGYAFSCAGVWGMDRQQLSPAGATYGDVAAAALWQGILASRAGVEYDYVVDSPRLSRLGYQKLIYIHEDATVGSKPKAAAHHKPLKLSLTLRPSTRPHHVKSPPVLGTISRLDHVKIDGHLTDWSSAQWKSLGPEAWYGDTLIQEVSFAPPEEKAGRDDPLPGATLETLTPELTRKYFVEAYPQEELLVVTSVAPETPAAESGFKTGDVLDRVDGLEVRNQMSLAQRVREARKLQKPLTFRIRRSGRSVYGGQQDLSAQFALAYDQQNLFLAVRVKDDTHHQTKTGWDIWKEDSVQLGLSPFREKKGDTFSENDHEIGFALVGGKAVAYRWQGRPGQPLGIITDAHAAISRDDGETLYEAAIPLASLQPLAPAVWGSVGVNLVVNDSDSSTSGGDVRKGRLELVPGASTRGKRPWEWASFAFDKPRPPAAGIIWDRRVARVGQSIQLTMGVASEAARPLRVAVSAAPLDWKGKATPLTRQTVPPHASEIGVNVGFLSPDPGRYRLSVSVACSSGRQIARDSLPVFIYR